MSTGSLVQDFGQRETFIASGALVPGAMIETPDGLAALVVGVRNVANGQEVTVTTDAIVSLPCASGTTFAVGALPQWDRATNLVVAAGGAGDYVLGSAWRAKTSGQAVAIIRLNRAKIAMPT